MKMIRITYNGGRIIEMPKEDYLSNKWYWDSQQVNIIEYEN